MLHVRQHISRSFTKPARCELCASRHGTDMCTCRQDQRGICFACRHVHNDHADAAGAVTGQDNDMPNGDAQALGSGTQEHMPAIQHDIVQSNLTGDGQTGGPECDAAILERMQQTSEGHDQAAVSKAAPSNIILNGRRPTFAQRSCAVLHRQGTGDMYAMPNHSVTDDIDDALPADCSQAQDEQSNAAASTGRPQALARPALKRRARATSNLAGTSKPVLQLKKIQKRPADLDSEHGSADECDDAADAHSSDCGPTGDPHDQQGNCDALVRSCC